MTDREDEMITAAEFAEAHEIPDSPVVRPLPPREASQVYSVRIPVERLEELRRLATTRGVAPSALMREWVLERLAVETVPQARTSRWTELFGQISLGMALPFGANPEDGLERLNEAFRGVSVRGAA